MTDLGPTPAEHAMAPGMDGRDISAIVRDLLVGPRVAAGDPAGGPARATQRTLLSVWAHPDDETYLSGALMAESARLGARVVCVTATRGELGGAVPPGSPPGLSLGQLRVAELAEALDVLGVREQVLLGLPDGGCADVPPAGPVERITEIIRAVEPAVVVTFGPDGFTGHPDHRAVSAWVTAAFERAAPAGARLLYAATTDDRADEFQDVDAILGVLMTGGHDDSPVVAEESLVARLRPAGTLLESKITALRAHASQTAGALALLGADRYAAWAAEEAFVEHHVSRIPRARTGR